MQKAKALLGYAGASWSIVALLLTPFVLIGLFTKLVAATGVQPDPVYSGGHLANEINRGRYRILVNGPVYSKGVLSGSHGFVQLTFMPLAGLGRVVHDDIDIDHDGKPDVSLTFEVTASPKEKLFFDAVPLGGSRVLGVNHVSKDSLAALIARVRDGIVVRVPLSKAP